VDNASHGRGCAHGSVNRRTAPTQRRPALAHLLP
jgi:hypothetical protein